MITLDDQLDFLRHLNRQHKGSDIVESIIASLEQGKLFRELLRQVCEFTGIHETSPHMGYCPLDQPGGEPEYDCQCSGPDILEALK